MLEHEGGEVTSSNKTEEINFNVDLNHNSENGLLNNEISNINNKLEIVHNYQFSLECSKLKIDTNSILDNFMKDNSELKKLNEILEREVNLLKSLLLVNNLNLNTTDSKPRK